MLYPASVNLRFACYPSTEVTVGSDAGTSQRNRMIAAPAPANCAATKSGASTGRMPAKVSENDLAIVTAGFANEVDAVNQYAAVM